MMKTTKDNNIRNNKKTFLKETKNKTKKERRHTKR